MAAVPKSSLVLGFRERIGWRVWVVPGPAVMQPICTSIMGELSSDAQCHRIAPGEFLSSGLLYRRLTCLAGVALVVVVVVVIIVVIIIIMIVIAIIIIVKIIIVMIIIISSSLGF